MLLLGGVWILLFGLNGCGFRMANLNSITEDQNKTDEVANIIIKALDQKNPELLKSVLSQKALQTSDLDEGIEYTFGLYEGTMTGSKSNGCPVGTRYGPEGRRKRAEGNYSITTDQGKTYDLFFEYVFISKPNPDEVGVNRIKISGEEEMNADEYIPGFRYICPGIYNPTWDSESDRFETFPADPPESQ